ncbi:MAG TPA: hypothetical protein VFW05_16340 [Verrucomicrobiae bacterium]|nr:hypothetical protein [Verrucomicrobiae bacterium]
MPNLKTELLREGMVVISDVKNLHDMLLIPAGAVLSERQIGILQAWGVADVEVEHSKATEETDPVAGLSEETRERLQAEIRHRFWDPDDSNPFFVELSKLLLQRRASKVTVNS